MAYQTKSDDAETRGIATVKAAIDAIGSRFEQFKAANDEQIAQLKAGRAVDPLLTEKVENLSKAVGEVSALKSQIEKLETLAARPGNGASEAEQASAEHKAAFTRWVRTGNESGLREAEKKAVNITTAADGGYAVPEQIDSSIEDLLKVVSPLRALCNVVTVSTSDYKKLVNKKGIASGWVGETTARTETSTPTLAEVAAINGEIYAFPQATQQSLDDVAFDVEQWLASEIAEEIAYQEGAAFVSGNGTNKPKGFLAYTTAATADATRTFGEIEHKVTGVAADFRAVSATASPADDLIDMIHAMKAGYRVGASWAANTLTIAKLRKVKDMDGAYIWRPGMEAGASDTLLGYPLHDINDMPSVAAGTLPLAFANWKRAYTIVDRVGTGINLRDPYSNKPYVGFYVTKRVGGMLVNSEAIKVLKVSV